MEIRVKKVIKRDGRVAEFDSKRIKNAIKKAMISVNKYSRKNLNKVLNHVLQIINEKYSEENIPHVEDIQDIVEFSLVKFDLYEVAKAYILYRKEREKIRQEKMLLLNKDYLDEVDKAFSLNAIRLLAARYLTKNEKGEIIEGPKNLFKRVAVHVVIPDILYDDEIFSKEGGYKSFPVEDFDAVSWDGKIGIGINKENGGYEATWNKYHLQKMKELYDRLNKAGKMKISWSDFFEKLRNGEFDYHYKEYREYFDLMVSRKFIPNSPTLFNSGTRLGQLSACFVLDINDDINSIMEAAKEAAVIFKTGGGIGINYSKLRPEGDIVSSTAGVASGPASFMRIIDVVTDVIKQGGCISTDNYLFTSLGLIKPDSIPIQNPRDDAVLPFTVFDGKSYTDAIAGSFGLSQDIYTIQTDYGYKVKVTYNELLATIDSNGEIQFKEAIHLSKDDYLVLVLGKHEGREIKLSELEELYSDANRIIIPSTLNEDLAEILGFYIGNGCWSDGKLIFSLKSTDKNFKDHIIKKIKSVFNLEPSEMREKDNYVDIIWSSKELEGYFEKRKWKKGSSTKGFIPDDILISKKNVIASFLKGLYEANGYIRKNGYIVFHTSSETLANQLQITLLSLGILSRLSKSDTKKIKKGLSDKDIYTIYIIGEESVRKFVNDIGFISSSKNEKAKHLSNKKFEYIRIIPNISRRLRETYEEIRKSDRKRAKKFYRKTYRYILGYRDLTYNRLKELSNEFEELKRMLRKYENQVFVKIKEINRVKEPVFHLETFSGRYVTNGFLIHNRRRGANMGILEVWHPDIEKFITSKSTPGVLENFNISVMITPDFWKKFKDDENYQLVNPRDKEVWKEVNARQLFRLAAEMAWKTGDPGVLFMDNINKRNILKKGMGDIRSTNPCITGDTYVYTPRGIREIRELEEDGETEICLDDRAVQREQKGKPVGVYRARGNVIKTGVKKVIKIKTEHGLVLRLTPEHKVRVAEENRSSHGYKLMWKETVNLRKGDLLLLNSVDMWEDWDENELTWELGYIAGYATGEGYTDKESVNLYFDGEKEKDLVDKVDDLIRKIFKVKPDIHRENGVIWLRINDKNIVNFFLKQGIATGKLYRRKLPRFVFKSPRKFILGFITGLWEADGSINISKGEDAVIRILSPSQDLLKDLQHILLALGIVGKLYLKRKNLRKTSHYIDKKGGEAYIIYGGHELVIGKDNVLRIAKLLKPLSENKIERLGKLPSANLRSGYYKEYFHTRIEDIEEDGEEEVYDIVNIPGHHAFVANGIIIHNCGEEPLYPYESCNLGSINLYAFIHYDEEDNKKFNWEEYEKVIRIATRFLDNVIDINQFPFESIEKSTRNSRKIGLGLMGLADMLFALSIPYNSEEGFRMMKKVNEYLTYHSMDESVEIAKKRGTFPLYDLSSYPDGEMPIEGFYHMEEWTLDWNKLRDKILKYGIRNAETTTIAPTGSISMIADTSSGIEPQFALVFEKRVTVGTFFYVDSELEKSLQQYGLYNDKMLKKISDNGGSLQGIEEIPKEMKRIFVVSYDIPWWDHVRAQAEISKWICAAVSKTINMPNWVTIDDVEKAYLFAYKLGAKGITIYRDGSKAVQVLITPSQKKGTYILEIENDTLDMMKKLGIQPPVMTKTEKTLAKSTLRILPKPIIQEEHHDEEKLLEKYRKCPECGSTRLIYTEGCLKCLDCGWSLCTTS